MWVFSLLFKTLTTLFTPKTCKLYFIYKDTHPHRCNIIQKFVISNMWHLCKITYQV